MARRMIDSHLKYEHHLNSQRQPSHQRKFVSRVSREQATVNRSTIKEVSARLLRERGINGVSVVELMAAAGFTHGGFYGHFDSKQALVAEACASAFEGGVQRWRKRIAGANDASTARNALIDSYLSDSARQSPGSTCPATALGGDVAREPADAPVRAAYLNGVEALIEILTNVAPGSNAATKRQQSLADFATMAGALMLARATQGHAISDEFLAAARTRLSGAPRLLPRKSRLFRRS
jgi:TetR/AcrR family transcriptional regulator, transcriptional repressor for nem operon